MWIGARRRRGTGTAQDAIGGGCVIRDGWRERDALRDVVRVVCVFVRVFED